MFRDGAVDRLRFRFRLSLALALALTLSSAAVAGEMEDLKKDLTLVQSRISEEEARYQQAKAQMERSQVVAQYVFPELRVREQQLIEKITRLEQEQKSRAEAKTK